ncbi:MAG: hypothetical protein RJA34_306 [Pseudomonadota bacterium]|jgi:Asp/Glu/hydantoin racemase
MARLLIINPNTSAHVSQLLQHHADQAAGTLAQVHTTTARFGAPYIACEASFAVAGHAVLDAWAAEVSTHRGFDAVLIGCFGDPGLLALREASPVPVTGLAEAAFTLAAAQGKFAIVTGGTRWKPMLERLAQSLGFDAQLAGVHTVTQSGAELAQDPVAAKRILSTACEQAAKRWGASTVILGGAGLAGMAQQIQPDLNLPVIDSVMAGVKQALALMQTPIQQGKPSFHCDWQGLSAEMNALALTQASAPTSATP